MYYYFILRIKKIIILYFPSASDTLVNFATVQGYNYNLFNYPYYSLPQGGN